MLSCQDCRATRGVVAFLSHLPGLGTICACVAASQQIGQADIVKLIQCSHRGLRHPVPPYKTTKTLHMSSAQSINIDHPLPNLLFGMRRPPTINLQWPEGPVPQINTYAQGTSQISHPMLIYLHQSTISMRLFFFFHKLYSRLTWLLFLAIHEAIILTWLYEYSSQVSMRWEIVTQPKLGVGRNRKMIQQLLV